MKVKLKTLEEYIKKIIGLEFIKLIKLKINTSILFIKKKGTTELQPYINYRSINVIIILNKYSILLILKIFNKLKKTIIFIKLNLKKVYNLICIYKKDK